MHRIELIPASLDSRPTSFRGKIRARQPHLHESTAENQPGSVVRSGFFARVLYVGDGCCHLKGRLGGHVVVTLSNISERYRRALLIPANFQGVEWSEWRDSNTPPLVPQTSALTGLRYTPTALLIGAVAAPRNVALQSSALGRRRARLRKDSLRLHNFGQ